MLFVLLSLTIGCRGILPEGSMPLRTPMLCLIRLRSMTRSRTNAPAAGQVANGRNEYERQPYLKWSRLSECRMDEWTPRPIGAEFFRPCHIVEQIRLGQFKSFLDRSERRPEALRNLTLRTVAVYSMC